MHTSRRLLFASVFVLVSIVFLNCGSGKTPEKTEEVQKDSTLVKKVPILIGTDSVEKDFHKRIVVQPLGDINGDGIEDTATIYPPRYISPSNPELGCLHDSCYCRIRFSCNLPDIYPVIGIGETLATVGDLNHDGFVELAFVPDWMTSVWHVLSVYGIKDGKWKLFGQGDINIEMMDADPDFFRHRVVRIDDRHFKILSDSLSPATDSMLLTHKTFTIK
jgi:hypothetical protein